MPPRPRKRATEAPTKQTNSFVEALRFIGTVTRDVGAPYETHCLLHNNTATAFNGIMAAGIKIEDDIYACPNNKMIVEALSKCGEHISITQLDNGRLSIKSDKFKAIVPCVDPTLLAPSVPDPVMGVVDDRLKRAFEVCGVIANENAQTVHGSSVLMQSGSLVATDGGIMFEYWHGIDLPPIAIPKSMVQAIVKCPKKLVSFGFSNASITFYFEDDSWLRTQLYSSQWPDVRRIIDIKSNAWAVPGDLFKALAAVAPFSQDGQVYFTKNLLRSHADNADAGATYEVEGLPQGPVHSIRQLKMIEPYAEQIDFFAEGPNSTMLMFFGQNIRGVIAGRG